MLGIIGAMPEEVEGLKNIMDAPQVTMVAGMEFYRGTISGNQVVVVRSGVGKVNAAMCVQVLADRFQVDGIVNTGIAGSLRTEINIGDIVLSTDALQHDVDATEFGYGPGEIPQLGVCEFVADKALLALAQRCCETVNPDISIHCGRVLTGDQFISDQEKKQRLIQTFDGYCTEMEGAAIAQAAHCNGIPFLIVRAISDKADGSAHMDYSEFEKMAICHSVNLTRAMIGAHG